MCLTLMQRLCFSLAQYWVQRATSTRSRIQQENVICATCCAADQKALYLMQYRAITPEDYELLSRLGLRSQHSTHTPDSSLHEASAMTRAVCETAELGRCIICLSDLDVGDELCSLRTCEHTFHATCLEVWLEGARGCPICREPLES